MCNDGKFAHIRKNDEMCTRYDDDDAVLNWVNSEREREFNSISSYISISREMYRYT